MGVTYSQKVKVGLKLSTRLYLHNVVAYGHARVLYGLFGLSLAVDVDHHGNDVAIMFLIYFCLPRSANRILMTLSYMEYLLPYSFVC